MFHEKHLLLSTPLSQCLEASWARQPHNSQDMCPTISRRTSIAYWVHCLRTAFVVAVLSGGSCVVAAEQTTKVVMRDGVTIATYVRTPAGSGRWPAVLKKGYGITKGGADTFVEAGYVYVSQGVRGGPDPHGISGDARFFADDVDGYDTIEWIAEQSWCDGNVGMLGGSYLGWSQTATASRRPKALKS